MGVPESWIYGCMQLGGNWSHEPLTEQNLTKGLHVLETAYQVGFRCFDHADIYTHGKSEQIFGVFLQKEPTLRPSLFIQSKAGIELNAGFQGSNRYNNAASYLQAQLNRSLERLQCDYLDGFLIHRPDPLTSVAEIAETLNGWIDSGLVKQVGVSNYPFDLFMALQSQMNTPLYANQLSFSLLNHSLLESLTDYNLKGVTTDSSLSGMWHIFSSSQVALQAWKPLDQGRCLEGVRADHSPSEAILAALITELSEAYGCSPSVIALAWLCGLPIEVQPVVGTTNPLRIKLLEDAGRIVLSREDWYRLYVAARGRPLP